MTLVLLHIIREVGSCKLGLRRVLAKCSRLPPRVPQPGSLRSRLSPEDTFRQCISSFTMVDNPAGTLPSSFSSTSASTFDMGVWASPTPSHFTPTSEDVQLLSCYFECNIFSLSLSFSCLYQFMIYILAFILYQFLKHSYNLSLWIVLFGPIGLPFFTFVDIKKIISSYLIKDYISALNLIQLLGYPSCFNPFIYLHHFMLLFNTHFCLLRTLV